MNNILEYKTELLMLIISVCSASIIQSSNIQLPMVTDKTSIGVLIISTLVIFGFIMTILHFGMLWWNYYKLNGCE